MAVYKTLGIILKRHDFGEADRILTIFTKRLGKINVIAKGVRKITSRKGGNVELFNLCSLFLAEGRNLDILSEVEVVEPFRNIREDLETVGKAYQVAEVVDQLTAERVESTKVFDLITEILKHLSKKRGTQLLMGFEVKLLNELGFWSIDGFKADLKVKKVLKFFEIEPFEMIERLKIEEDLLSRLELVLRTYIEQIIEKELKSKKFMRKIKEASES